MEEEEIFEPVEKNLAIRRKNEWKHAKKNAQINKIHPYKKARPLHYYSKNSPEKTIKDDGITISDQRRLDSCNEQYQEEDI